jgi:hypothetical protein
VDSLDHVFIVNRNDMTDKEAEVSKQAPPFIEFDADGKLVNSFDDRKTVPNTTHSCTIDYAPTYRDSRSLVSTARYRLQSPGSKGALSYSRIKNCEGSVEKLCAKGPITPARNIAPPLHLSRLNRTWRHTKVGPTSRDRVNLAPGLRNLIAALDAVHRASARRHPRATAEDAVGNGVVDLIKTPHRASSRRPYRLRFSGIRTFDERPGDRFNVWP